MTRQSSSGALIGVMAAAAVLGGLSVAPTGCSKFSETASADASDAAAEAGASSGDASNGAPERRLYVFGGERIELVPPAQTLTTAYSAVVAADGSLGPWEPAPAYVIDRAEGAFTVQDGTAMFFGGLAGGTPTTQSAQKATLGSAAQGSGAAWSELPLFKLGRSFASAAGANRAVYLSGGTASNDSRSTEIDRYDIAVGAWSTPATLNEALAGHATLVRDGHLYVIGGEKLGKAGASQASSAAQIMDDGSLAGWGSVGVLPVAAAYHGLVHVEPYLFTIGGAAGAAGKTLTSVQRGIFDASGNLDWTNYSDVPVQDVDHGVADACVVTDGRTFYVIGGRKDATSPSLQAVNIGRIDAKGAVTWSPGPVLPEGRAGAGCVISPSSAP
jgi:hypothetical protein